MTARPACRQLDACLSRYVDGRLGLRAELRVRRHLDRCEACRSALALTRRVARGLAELRPEAPLGLAERVRRAERRRARGGALRRGLARASAAAVLLSVAGFAALAISRVLRGPASIEPRLVSAPRVEASAPEDSPAPPGAPGGLERVVDGPALAEWARARGTGDAEAWLAAEPQARPAGPAGGAGSPAGFRAPAHELRRE